MEIKLAYEDIENVRQLFSEYTDLTVSLEPTFQDYLDLQNFDSELDTIAKKYAMPMGRLYVAYVDGNAAGCIALFQLSDTECEMKRLYVRPQFAGCGIGKALANKIIEDATDIGYKYMVLDTFPALQTAIKMYENMGFYHIPPFSNSPVENTVFMRLDL